MAERETTIEVAFATPEKQLVVKLEVPVGTQIGEAVSLSGIQSQFPDHDLSVLPLGVWNEVKPQHYVVQPGDRVEVYRSLLTNAKEARRRRAILQKEKAEKTRAPRGKP